MTLAGMVTPSVQDCNQPQSFKREKRTARSSPKCPPPPQKQETEPQGFPLKHIQIPSCETHRCRDIARPRRRRILETLSGGFDAHFKFKCNSIEQPFRCFDYLPNLESKTVDTNRNSYLLNCQQGDFVILAKEMRGCINWAQGDFGGSSRWSPRPPPSLL